MATTTCPTCSLEYDDLYRWTFCPHASFEMRCATFQQVEGINMVLVCTSIPQQDAWQACTTLTEADAMGAVPADGFGMDELAAALGVAPADS